MRINEKVNLNLIGKNTDDLKVISAYLQDSIVKIKDIVFLKKNRTFIMMLSRFMWEDVEKGIFRENKRVKCALKFDEVIEAKSKNINQKKKDRALECLAIKCTSALKNYYEINFFFSGDGIITIIAETLEVSMKDIGEPWKVKHAPLHKI